MQRWQLKRAAQAVHDGGVIAYPTEAIYGLGCDPLNSQAVLRLLALKQRPMEKGLILIADHQAKLAPYMAPLTQAQQDKLDATWPGPVTWLVPARPETPRWLRGQYDTIAVRVTGHPLAAALCQQLSHALVSTSANPTGKRPARSTLKIRQYFGDQLDCILSGPLGDQATPTEICDLTSGRIIRPA
jgi:L-threonylcarbamoyladenylate synthase